MIAAWKSARLCGSLCHRVVTWLVVGIMVLMVLLSCSAESDRQRKGALVAFVSIPPQAYFVEKVAADRVEVEVLLPPGQSPATYEPTPQQMARLSEADLLLTTGVPFEKQLVSKITRSLEQLKIVDTGQGVKGRPIAGHRHGGEIHLGSPDPHIWLDPNLAKIQAQNISTALERIDPANASFYELNLLNFQEELDSVDAAVRELLVPFRGRTIRVFHPAYGYFTDAYGLHQEAIEIEGKEPSARQLAEIIEQAKEETTRAVFVQPQFSRKQAQMIAGEIGAEVVVLDPLARDYLNNLWDIATKMASALGGQEETEKTGNSAAKP